MKITADTINRLQAQAEAARQKAAAAAEEAADLNRRAERLETLEDQGAGQARRDAARYSELAARFAAEADKLEREACIAAATLARDEAREELKAAEAALAPFVESAKATAAAYGRMEAALSDLLAVVPAGKLDGLSYPQFSFSERLGIERFWRAAAKERGGQDGRMAYESERVAIEHLAAELPKLLAHAQAKLAATERALSEAKA